MAAAAALCLALAAASADARWFAEEATGLAAARPDVYHAANYPALAATFAVLALFCHLYARTTITQIFNQIAFSSFLLSLQCFTSTSGSWSTPSTTSWVFARKWNPKLLFETHYFSDKNLVTYLFIQKAIIKLLLVLARAHTAKLRPPNMFCSS